MKTISKTLIMLMACGAFFACEDEVHSPILDYPNDVTFNVVENSLDIEVPELDFIQLDAPFVARAYKEGSITLNAKKNSDGTHTGFALSNKNYRSFPWCNCEPFGNSQNTPEDLIQRATDTLLYSCYTGTTANLLSNFAVARIEGEEAFFTIDQPRVVEHVLVSNCTFNYLAMNYGSVLSNTYNKEERKYERLDKEGKLSVCHNPNIPDPTDRKFGVWYLPDYYDFSNGEPYTVWPAEGAYFKLIATGYNNGTKTGSSEYYLAVRKGVAPAPCDKWDILQNFWAPWDLSSLGEVDKVVFTFDTSIKDSQGNAKLAPYFCLDGIRLK